MRKQDLLYEIETFIFSQDDISYHTVRCGWCTDATMLRKYCQRFRNAGVDLEFSYDRGDPSHAASNFRFSINTYNEGMIERARRVMREINAEKGQK